MKQLRQYIRQILFEIYQMTPEEQKRSEDLEKIGGPNSLHRKRVFGIQRPEEIHTERDFMRSYQNDLQSSDEGKRFIDAFTKGKDVTIFHSINYVGYAASMGQKVDDFFHPEQENNFSNWIKKYGKKGKDSISTVASNVPLENNLKMETGSENSKAVYGFGFIMKGYPVLVSETDMMTQTLGALPKGLVKHQKNSGIAKRGMPNSSHLINNLEQFRWAGEVVLDNWQIQGTYYNFASGGYLGMNNLFSRLVQDSIDLGLPMYVYDSGLYLGKITDEKSYNELLSANK